jgi:hypothetical protein
MTGINETWPFPALPANTVYPIAVLDTPLPARATADYWTNPLSWRDSSGNLITDPTTGALRNYQKSSRVAEDVILTNVIGFDVKAWDPDAPIFAGATAGTVLGPGDFGYPPGAGATQVGAGAYVNLGYLGTNISQFSNVGNYPSTLPRVYDTWSTHYESDGINQNQARWFDTDGDNTQDPGEIPTDEGTDGIDNDRFGGVDDFGEQEAPPPYAVPLRGIQVKIRVFEPDSRQIREVTVVQDFLPE